MLRRPVEYAQHALVSVDDLQRAVFGQRHLHDLPGVTRLQGGRNFVRHDPACGHVHDGREVDEALAHGDVSGVQRPHLVARTTATWRSR